MPRDDVLIEEMVEAAEQAIEILGDLGAEALSQDRIRRDAVLWNLMVREKHRVR